MIVAGTVLLPLRPEQDLESEIRNVYHHSLVDYGSSQLYLSVCVCLSVCPAFTAYISITMGRIFRKLGGNVGT